MIKQAAISALGESTCNKIVNYEKFQQNIVINQSVSMCLGEPIVINQKFMDQKDLPR